MNAFLSSLPTLLTRGLATLLGVSAIAASLADSVSSGWRAFPNQSNTFNDRWQYFAIGNAHRDNGGGASGYAGAQLPTWANFNYFGAGLEQWLGGAAGAFATVGRNTSDSAVPVVSGWGLDGAEIPPGQVFIHTAEDFSILTVVGYLVPATGSYNISGYVKRLCTGGVNWYLDVNAQNIASGSTTTDPEQHFDIPNVFLNAGDYVYLLFQHGGSFAGDLTGIDLVVSPNDISGGGSDPNPGQNSTFWAIEGPTGATAVHAEALSADGRVVVGYFFAGAGSRAFRWSATEGLADLGPGQAKLVSADGSVVAGNMADSNGYLHAFRWTAAEGIVDLGTLNGPASRAFAMSADGSVIVGQSALQSNWPHAFRWTASEGMTDLGSLGEDSLAQSVSRDGRVAVGYSLTFYPERAFAIQWTATEDMKILGNETVSALAVSADGETIVGQGYSGTYFPFRWTAASGIVDLGFGSGSAHLVSTDGSVIVGSGGPSRNRAFRWSAEGRVIDLGDLSPTFDYTSASAISADGEVVVGGSAVGSFEAHPFLWTESSRMQDLTPTLALWAPGWTFLVGQQGSIDPLFLSSDGSVIVGNGLNPTGHSQPWILHIGRGPVPQVNWANPSDINYGTPLNPDQLNATVTHNGSPISGTFAYSPPSGTVLTAGDHPLSLTFTPIDTVRFSPVSATVTLSVRKAPLSITAENQFKPFGALNPPLTASYNGFVNGDGPEDLTTSPILETAAVQSSDFGTYSITVSGASSPNYEISYVPGILTVFWLGSPSGPIFNSANGHVYYLLDWSDWHAANAMAQLYGGHLVTINNQEEQDFINLTFSGFGGADQWIWIGLHDPDPVSNAADPLVRRGEFTWVTGEPVTYSNWLPTEPNNFPENNGEFYAQTTPSSYWNGQGWLDYIGAGFGKGLVEVPTPEAIAGPITNPETGSQYYLLSQSIWQSAEFAAQQMGGHLATIRNQQEQDFVFDTFGNYGGISRHLMIGLHDADPSVNASDAGSRRAEFVWASGEAVIYSNWDPFNPDNWNNSGEFWVNMFAPTWTVDDQGTVATSRGGDWNDISAINGFGAAPLNGVVEISAPAVLSGPATNPQNGREYYLLSQSTWEAAEAVAQQMGGHLATIRNSQEQSFVFDAFANFSGISRHLMIGLHDPDHLNNSTDVEARKAEFVWASGEPVAYSNWSPGEPNNFNGAGEFWVNMFAPVWLGEDGPIHSNGEWNDVGGGTGFGNAPQNGVVEITPPTPPNQAPTTSADSFSTRENHPLTITFGQLLANDSDPDGDALGIQQIGPSSIQGGTVAVDSANGFITYSPASGFAGSDNFTYTVHDSRGAESTATVHVAVVPNIPPAANPDTAATTLNKAISFAASKLTLNDTDAEGDPLTVTSTSALSAMNGTVTLENGTITYAPALNFEGTDTFTYQLGDGQGGLASGTVTISVRPLLTLLPTSVTMQPAGSALVRFLGKPRIRYTVQASQDGATWMNIASVTAALNGAFSATDINAVSFPGRTYRAYAP